MRIIIRTYQIFISPLIHWVTGPGSGCRFEPTCSQYAVDATSKYGFWKGSRLAIRRILKCQPFSKNQSRFDPVD